MIYEIKKYGDSVLRKIAEKVEEVNDEIREILRNMVETMYARDGVGLAAPQVGISLRMFVCDIGTPEESNVKKIINPLITPLTEETISVEEGCLSIPGIYKKVERIAKLKLEYQNEQGEFVEEILEGFPAIVVQHEYDHLEATLFVDRVSPMAKRMIAKKLQALKKETMKDGRE
ncbi:peptide deformylase [Fusobacterium necrophorum subsp. funduliforme]|uniref:Peptide deformylase n=2 Tax=Fusobacterium necrophorum TaxID=859 RepID=A0AAN4ASQ2_9FUSO|nr:peptide deformylase [Fusobacterium necrophorum]AYV95507.1 peptide deformylase [Fusobacterium necrophorum subsp. funduliforme]EFS24115.1 peptide deformylase [Fusobacterium necrophorum D12]EJU16537.1 peptide deformylase [Fusobacterium necrophorum subsp. funduliforme Fnf 1007]KYL00746.1 peptide deformylase [Fusobacterium necrophorum subsp. funduliforme]KYL02006.1 peptide deformylase [Fusobacterium necrophorum subsp. funduliforme]